MQTSIIHDEAAEIAFDGVGQRAASLSCSAAWLDDESLAALQHGYSSPSKGFVGGACNLGRQLRCQLARLSQGAELRCQGIIGCGQMLQFAVQVGQRYVRGKLP